MPIRDWVGGPVPVGWVATDEFSVATPARWRTYLWNGTVTGSPTTTYTSNTININWTTSTSSTVLHNYWARAGDMYSNYTVDPWGPAPTTRWRAREPAPDVQAAREARSVARTAARERADELLLLMLSRDQRESYQLRGEFEVIGSAGGVYRIRRGSSGNVDWIEPDGRIGARLCAHPTMAEGWMPDQDVALAQMLALRTDEPGFVALANVHAGRRPAHL